MRVVQENLNISQFHVLSRATPNSFFIMCILDERLLIKEEHQRSIQIYVAGDVSLEVINNRVMAVSLTVKFRGSNSTPCVLVGGFGVR